MILTNCAACAAPLAHDHKKKCSRCKTTQSNLAITYGKLGRVEQALQIERDVYSGRRKLQGDEHAATLQAAFNYAVDLVKLNHFEEAKALLRELIPVSRRVLGESHDLTIRMRWILGEALYRDDGATFDDLREAVTTLEDTERIARRVRGGAHPLTGDIEWGLGEARAALRARETPSRGSA